MQSRAFDSWRPKFIREIRQCADQVGMLQATNHTLARNNITIAPKGDVERLREHQGGLLFIGNHNKQFEFVALMAVLGQLGRTSMKNIVKCYVEDQVDWALGKTGKDIVLPVYPRLLATDRKNKLNAELPSRLVFRRSLLTTAESERRNQETISDAASELGTGGVVNIFPCGSIVNNMVKPWRSGVGRILAALPEQDREDVLVVPYHADNLRRYRLAGAIAARGHGFLGRPQQVDLTFGHPVSAASVFDAVPLQMRDDPAAITDVLRQHYVTQLVENDG